MRLSRWWDLPAVLMLVAALLTAFGRLIATDWVEHLSLVQTLVLFGVAAGLALGQSIFSPVTAFLFGVLYGLFAVPWQLGLTAVTVSEDALWSDRLVVLANRLTNALSQLAQQEPVRDPILFLAAMAVLAWGLSVHAGYALTRHASPWCIILPPGLAVVLIHTSDLYRPRGVWYLVGYFVFALLLLARLTLMRLRRSWLQDNARVPPLVDLDLGYAMIAVVVLLNLLAWTVPTRAGILPSARRIWERVTSPWEERTDRLFASLRRRGATVTAADYYSDDFRLGRGRELSDDLVASVQVPDAPSSVRYYWRAKVYDDYADGRWSTKVFSMTERVGPDGPMLDLPELEGRRSLTFTFTAPQPIITLYLAPQPRRVDQRVEVDFAQNPDNTVDVSSFRALPALGAGEPYVAHASIADMTVSQLRDAGAAYPQWVTDRYLQLPETITGRTRELAKRITEEAETPYDAVAAITRYLRSTIRYSETITDTLPLDQEPLDWFLFDLRLGFCNYYASSEVILLRSLGIPARLAVGFAEGERQRGTSTILVYERNAHAWPEVYFPGFGWVEFEPTVSQDTIHRPLGGMQTDDEGRLGFPAAEAEDRWREQLEELRRLDDLPPGGAVPRTSDGLWGRIWSFRWILPILLLILMILIRQAWDRRDFPPFPVVLEKSMRRMGWRTPAFLRRWARRAMLSPVERAYGEVDRALTRLGGSALPADTPAERAAALIGLLPPASEPTHRLLSEYEAATYSSHRYDLSTAQEAARSIRDLSWRARLRRVVGRR